jgi:hypothetical protein
MGWLVIITYIAVTIWIWTRFGVLAGIVIAVLGFALLQVIGPRIDKRFGDRSTQFLEFHYAWDNLMGPPFTPDALAAKRLWLRYWRQEWKGTRISAHDWLVARIQNGTDDRSI